MRRVQATTYRGVGLYKIPASHGSGPDNRRRVGVLSEPVPSVRVARRPNGANNPVGIGKGVWTTTQPLKDWIDSHPNVRHNLSLSGMAGSLQTVSALFSQPRKGAVPSLRRRLGELVGVDADRLFLTHGATEGFGLVLSYLSSTLRARLGRAPRVRVARPEYPYLPAVASALGMTVVSMAEDADLFLASDPSNPRGVSRGRDAISTLIQGCSEGLVDETFREFTDAGSILTRGASQAFVTGTFTKVYGGDALRVGYVVSPESQREEFSNFHGLLTDEIAPHSVDLAETFLDHRDEVVAESRAIFRRNFGFLRKRMPAVPELTAPLTFDQQLSGIAADELAASCLEAGVLVCSGSLFDDPSGVRICLTRRSFPEDLEAYLGVKEALIRQGGERSASSRKIEAMPRRA